MRSKRFLVSLTLTVALLANATSAGAVALRRIDSVSFADATHGWIAGGRDPNTGFVSYTTDGQTFRTTTAWNRWFDGVVADGASTGWAISSTPSESVRRSVDGGKTWTGAGSVPLNPNFELNGGLKLGSRVVVFGQNRGVTADSYFRGDLAVIASSVNGGSSWSRDYQGPLYPIPEESDPLIALSEFVAGDTSSDGSVGMIAGNEFSTSATDGSKLSLKTPLIMKTVDGGSTWTTMTANYTTTSGNWVTDVTAGSSTVAFAGTNATSRVLMRTTDGVTWQQLLMPRDFSNVYLPNARVLDAWDEDTLVVGGNSGFLAWSENAKLAASNAPNDGFNWRFAKLPGGPNINSVQVLSATSAIAVGDEETIAKTNDKGVTWTPLPAGPPVATITGPGASFQLSMAPITIRGTARDPGVGVEKVEVRIRRADGLCWNGLGWVSGDFWLPASSADQWDTWSLPWTPDATLLASGQMVTIAARGTDAAGLSAISAGVTSGVPIFGSVSLAGGDSHTTTTTVTASISANGATHMRWRVIGGEFNTWRPFASTASISLPGGDGLKTVEFEFSTDGATTVAVANDSITLHTSIPSVAISSPGAGFGTLAAVPIAGTASDSGGSVKAVDVRIGRGDNQYWNGSAWTTADSWLPATTTNGYANWTYNWTPPSDLGNQIVTIQARATDMANLRQTTAAVSSGVATGASVSLASGAAYTDSTTVPVAIAAAGATHMRWRVNGASFPTTWTPYSSSANVALGAGDGTKTVDFQFSPDGATTIATASDTIVLHTTQPSVQLLAPASGWLLTLAPVAISGTASDVGLSVSSVQLLIRRADGQSWNGTAWSGTDTWLNTTTNDGYSTWSYPWNPGAAAVDPGHIVTVYARAYDTSGLSTVSPGRTSGSAVRGSAMLSGGDGYTATRTVAAAVSAEAMTWMRYRVSGETSSTWQPFKADPSVYIGGVDGSKTVTFEFTRNTTGSVEVLTSASIYYDGTKPAASIAVPKAGFALAGPMTLSGAATDAASGVSEVQVSLQRGSEYWNGSSWQGLEAWVDATVSGGSWTYDWNMDASTTTGHLPVTVRARSKDKAGNVSPLTQVQSVDPLDSTAAALTSPSTTLSYGGTGYVKGTLTLLGEPLTNASVILRAGTSPSTLKDTTLRGTTDSLGQFSIPVKPSAKTYYQVRYVAPGRAEAKTGYITFTPKVYLSTPYAPRYARKNVAFSSYGYIKPRHTAGTYPVRLYLYRYVNGTYRYYRYVNAKASNYSTYTKYTGSVKLPYAGKWRIQAYHYDAAHAKTTSSYRYVTVR